MKTKITVICEKNVHVPLHLTEHSLSPHIENEDFTWFDAGWGWCLLTTSKCRVKKQIQLNALYSAMEHYDHTGGLPVLLENRKEKIHVFLPDSRLNLKRNLSRFRWERYLNFDLTCGM